MDFEQEALAADTKATAAALRLQELLQKKGFPRIGQEKVKEAIEAHFDSRSIAYGEWLVAGAPDLEWHAVQLSQLGYDAFEIDCLHCQSSLARALAVVIDSCDATCVTPDDIHRREDGAIVFGVRGVPLAAIWPVEFSEVLAVDRGRVVSALSGVRAKGDTWKAAYALRRIPGFGSADGDPYADVSPRGGLLAPSLKGLRAQMGVMLGMLFGGKVSIGLCQEALAAFLGVDSWNHLAPFGCPGRSGPEPFVIVDDRFGGLDDCARQEIPFFRDAFEALWAFGKMVDGRSDVATVSVSNALLGGLYVCAKGERLAPSDRFSSTPFRLSTSNAAIYITDESAVHDLANRVAESPCVVSALRSLFQVDDPAEFRWRASRIRYGCSAGDLLVLGDWAFSVDSRGLMSIDSFREKRHEEDRRLVALYKAALSQKDGAYKIFSDYGRKEAAILNGLSDEDATRLLEFMRARGNLWSL